MSLWDGVTHRLSVLLRGEAYQREVERELRFHLELARLAATGRPEHEAELIARRTLGNDTYFREEVRRMTLVSWLDHLRQDARYAWRGLVRSPAFTAMVMVTLGLGVGVNAAMFSLLDQLFVRPPAGVVAPGGVHRWYVEVPRPTEPDGRYVYDSFAWPEYTSLLDAMPAGVQLAGYDIPDSTDLVRGDARVPIRTSRVTQNYFHLAGVRPSAGRFFVSEEQRVDQLTHVLVLSEPYWRRVFGADPRVVGSVVTLGTTAYTIVGVAARDFVGLDVDETDAWVPLNNYSATSGYSANGRLAPWYESFTGGVRVVVRAAPGVQASLLGRATVGFRRVHIPGWAYYPTAKVLGGPISRVLGPIKRPQELTIATRLAAVAAIVLLIACANVANLLLLRSARRRREIAVRRAIGVSRWRLYEQMLTEALLVSVLGAVAALAFAYWSGAALRQLLFRDVHWAGGVIDGRTIAFAVGVSMAAGVVAALSPALLAFGPDLTGSLKAASLDGARRSRLRAGLVVVQTTLSVVLLVGAGLFVRSLSNVRDIDLGFDAHRTLAVYPELTGARPPASVLAPAFARIAERVRAMPGVEATAYASAAPMLGGGVTSLFLPGHDSLPRLGGQRGARFTAVSPGYFATIGTRIVAGRDFTSTDDPGGERVMVVSQAMARAFWPGDNPLGKCLIVGEHANPCTTVVGVAADMHESKVIEGPVMHYYLPLSQADAFFGPSALLVRVSARGAAGLMPLISREIQRELPAAGAPTGRTIEDRLERQFRPWRLGAVLFTLFGLLALAVAAVGVYSVVAYAAAQRTHEMGVRCALGARMGDVMDLVMREGLGTVGVGIAVGILAAVVAGRFVASLLFGVVAADPSVLLVAAVALCATGMLACVIPAWRAAKVDPVTALRSD